jgi:glycosyltransferase involved in cell wall biosynthesis
MKIVGITPMKNEQAFIDSFATSVTKICDKVIVLDDNSTDNSVELLKKYDKIEFISINDENGWGGKRSYLYNLARDYSATHIVALDADEVFSDPFVDNLDSILDRLNPGFKVALNWLAMWKTTSHYRNDYSVWSNNYKDFLIHDDGKLNYDGGWIHEPRLPITENYIKIPTEQGAVLHYQFSCWDAFQIKQSWYRCLEKVRNKHKSAGEINQTYRITLDDNNVMLSEIHESWKRNIIEPNLDEVYNGTLWRINDIKNWLNEYGVDYFRELDIWHVKEIRDLLK